MARDSVTERLTARPGKRRVVNVTIRLRPSAKAAGSGGRYLRQEMSMASDDHKDEEE